MDPSRRRRHVAAMTLLATLALAVAGCGASPRTGSSGSAESTRAKAVKFAECMRSNDVRDFPDPNAKGNFDYGISVSPAVWQKAVNACKRLQPPGIFDAHRKPAQQSASLKFAQCMRENGVPDFPDPANGDPLIDTTHIPSSNRPGGMTILNATIRTCHGAMAQALGGQQ
jgi:hypothetical protein